MKSMSLQANVQESGYDCCRRGNQGIRNREKCSRNLLQEHLFISKYDDIIWCAVENVTKLLHRVHRNRFVALQIGNGVGTETMFIDQGVGCYFSVFHSFPQRLIADHTYTHLSK